MSEESQEEEEVVVPTVIRTASWPQRNGSPEGDRLRVKRDEKPVSFKCYKKRFQPKTYHMMCLQFCNLTP